MTHEIGVISDTHGLLRPEAVAASRGVERILHAGDVGRPGILEELRRLAPLTAVRGNVDRESWPYALPSSTRIEYRDQRRADSRPGDRALCLIGEGRLWRRDEDCPFA